MWTFTKNKIIGGQDQQYKNGIGNHTLTKKLNGIDTCSVNIECPKLIFQLFREQGLPVI